MSAGITLEEKFEALMKNCEAITTTNEELKNYNEYLRYQLGESLKQKRKILASASSSPGSA